MYRNRNKVLALLLAIAMLISVMPFSSVMADTKTTYHETFADGKGAVAQSGGASIEKVGSKVFDGNSDGAAIYVSNRKNNWDAADFKFADIGLKNGKTYNVTVKGFVDSNAKVPAGAQAFLQVANSYSWLAGAEFVAGKAFTLNGKYTVDTSKDDRVRVQSNDEGKEVPFYIGDISITEEASEAVPEDSNKPKAEVIKTITFEDNTAGGFVGRDGSEKLTVTKEANHTDGGSYALKVENRTMSWHGPSMNIEKLVSQGSEYKITAWVKLISPESSQLQLSTQVGNGGSASYVSLAAKTIGTSDGWVKYEGTYRYNNVSSGFITMYIESASSANASFYIDDITLEKTGSEPIKIQNDLKSIKDVYKKDFLIGNAIAAEDMEGIRLDLLKKHFNVMTAGNAMKPDALQPTKGNFTFADADKLVDKVLSEGFKMHGHTLVWHQQSPAWLNTKVDASGNSVPLSREEALTNLRTHIKTVVEHYGNKVISWDVVNEGMNDNPTNPSDWKAALRQSPWYQAIGPDYMEQAFLAAREVLDAHPNWDVKLYYNDYNDDNQNKSKAIYYMVKELNEKYTKTHPGKLLIDGVGMQAHYNMSTNPSNVELSLVRFISLGVEVSITELDVQAGSDFKLTDEIADAQGYLYAQLFDIYKKHAANISRVTIWGLDDGTSWRSSTNPLPFDKNLQAKPAFTGVVDPTKFMAEHKPQTPKGAKSATAKFGTPVIDGTVDSVWSKAQAIPVNTYQMAWQGATATAKALWDDKNLYVLVQVSDSELDKKSANTYEQDSVEVFVDENNGKTSYYENDDGQYRVNFDNEASFNPAAISAGFVSATKVAGKNYTVEMKIPLKSVTPSNNMKIGFDVQVNDAKDGSRKSVASWNDTTGTGYQDTSVYGVLTFSNSESSNTANYITRGEFIDSVIKALGLNKNVQVKDSFKDVAKDASYYASVSVAYQKGIVSGYRNGEFKPQSTITRQEAMTIIAKAMKAAGKNINYSAADINKILKEFKDSNKVAGWAKGSVAACIKAGIVSGKSGKLLAPQENITVSQTEAIVKKLSAK